MSPLTEFYTKSEIDIKIENLEKNIGDVETAIDSIITIQNELIGGSEV